MLNSRLLSDCFDICAVVSINAARLGSLGCEDEVKIPGLSQDLDKHMGINHKLVCFPYSRSMTELKLELLVMYRVFFKKGQKVRSLKSM